MLAVAALPAGKVSTVPTASVLAGPLGHKSRAMTDVYHDDRGREWKVVKCI